MDVTGESLPAGFLESSQDPLPVFCETNDGAASSSAGQLGATRSVPPCQGHHGVEFGRGYTELLQQGVIAIQKSSEFTGIIPRDGLFCLACQCVDCIETALQV